MNGRDTVRHPQQDDGNARRRRDVHLCLRIRCGDALFRSSPAFGLQPVIFEDRRTFLEHQLGDGEDQRVGMIGTALAAIAARGEGAELILEHGERPT